MEGRSLKSKQIELREIEDKKEKVKASLDGNMDAVCINTWENTLYNCNISL